MMVIPVASVVFRADLYPRIKPDPVVVQKYAEDLDVLPPITVNQHHELIDGWHRWTAHKKNGAETIKAEINETQSDAQLLELAIAANATHGLQLSQQDKQDMARRIYNSTPVSERDATKIRLARVLSVSEKTIYRWLSRIDKDTERELERKAFDLWLSCHTQEEIAEAVGWSQQKTSDFTKNGQVSDFGKTSLATFTDPDWKPPIYNIWKQQEKSATAGHFGNTEATWLENLLYLYTDPFDIVIDPFAGGGSTIDMCRKRYRRYWASDRKPVVEREHEIRKHDLTDGPPALPRWRDAKLVYLDPPYWKQAEGQYSSDPTDLANMSLEDFNSALSGIINTFAKKLSHAYIALVIQPTQWKAPERRFTDHVADMLKLVNLPVEMRFSAPYESQQCNAQMVEWAKANKRCLVLTREIIVWRVE